MSLGSRPDLLRRGVTIVCFWDAGRWPCISDVLTSVVRKRQQQVDELAHQERRHRVKCARLNRRLHDDRAYNWLLLELLDESYSGALQISRWLIDWLMRRTSVCVHGLNARSRWHRRPTRTVHSVWLPQIPRAWANNSEQTSTGSATAVLPPPGQRCGTVYLNSFGNRTSPSDNSNDRWKRLCLVSWAAAPCVLTLMALPWLEIFLLTYLLTYLLGNSLSVSLRVGYLSVRMAGGASTDVDWRRTVWMDLFSFLLTYSCHLPADCQDTGFISGFTDRVEDCTSFIQIIRTLRRAVLTVVWIGSCCTGPTSLCLDSFVFMSVYYVFIFYTVYVFYYRNTVGWT